MSWARLRRKIYDRDGGICRVCGLRVGKVWDCGHLQDRIVGGLDTLDNLVLMCVRCNRSLKPIHTERREALGWMVRQRMQIAGDWQAAWQLASGKAQADEQAALAQHGHLERRTDP